MKFFSKEKFIAAEGYNEYLVGHKWVDECDGKPVRDGFCGRYVSDDEWCIEVPDDVSNHPRYKIVIEGYKSTTLATMYADDKVIKRTVAKRHPADKFNWRIGAQTAFNRLWEKKKPKKPVVREVKRHAKPGEWVKVVNATVDDTNDYKNGDMLLIVPYTGTSTCEYAHYKDKGTKFLYDDEYVVLEGYKPE